MNAVLVGANTWRLSQLLRGQAGSDPAMLSGALAGAAFAPLTPDLQRLNVSQSERGLPLLWRASPAGSSAAGQSSVDLTATWNGVALRPFSPCHIAAKRQSDGSLLISWIRRARQNGDNLDVEPPLCEETEAYQVSIWSGARLVRTLGANQPSAVYSPALQALDFPGGTPNPLSVSVQQLSAVYGWGAPGQGLLLY